MQTVKWLLAISRINFPYERYSWYSVDYRLPPRDVVVIALDDEGKISFAHRVDTTTTKHYHGWNIPGVRYWMSFSNPSEF